MNFRKTGYATVFVLTLVLMACGGKQEKEKQDKKTVSGNAAPERTVISGDTLKLALAGGEAWEKVHKPARDKKFFVFRTDVPGKLTARLETKDKHANLRFSQIFMPDGTADGPFGQELQYDLDTPGTYILAVGESQMAGEPWAGDFTITVKVE